MEGHIKCADQLRVVFLSQTVQGGLGAIADRVSVPPFAVGVCGRAAGAGWLASTGTSLGPAVRVSSEQREDGESNM